MCRNIKTLFNFEPPATDEEIRASALQFVRKLSGSIRPSKVNTFAFESAVDKIETITHELLNSLVTKVPSKDRVTEAAKAKLKASKRFSER